MKFAVPIPLIALALVVVSAQTTPSLKNDPVVMSSRRAIVETGVTDRYFDEHFELLQLINRPGDLRVVWKYKIGGYEVLLNDAIGSSQTSDKKLIYFHSIKNLLGRIHDVHKTISRTKARQLMKQCIGSFTGESVVFTRLSSGEDSTFHLLASGTYKRKESEPRDSRQNKAANSSTDDDGEDEEGEKPPPVPIAYINLENGKCRKAAATVAGAPALQKK